MPSRRLPDPLDRIVPAVVDDLTTALGARELLGVYLYGSAASGGFDPELSDLDLVVVTERSVDAIPFDVVAGIIDRLRKREPEWANRLDIVVIDRHTLAEYRSGGPFLEVSHDLPLRLLRRADDWLETWFLARDADWAIAGPPAASVFARIDIDEFLQALIDDVERYAAAVRDDWPHGQVAYRVLTLCRLLRSLESRALCSKQEGVEWVAMRRPDLAPLLRAAWDVRTSGERGAFTPAERGAMPDLLAELAATAKQAA